MIESQQYKLFMLTEGRSKHHKVVLFVLWGGRRIQFTFTKDLKSAFFEPIRPFLKTL